MTKINIDLPGGINLELPQWATEETLLRLTNNLNLTGTNTNNFNAALRKALKNLGGGSGTSKNTFTGSVGEAAKVTKKLADEQDKTAKAMRKAKEYLADISDVTGSLVGGNGSFTMLNLAVDKTAKVASEVAGGLAENVPGVKAAAVAFSEGTKIITQFNLAVAQDTLEMLSALGKQGFGLGDNFQQLTQRVLSTGLNLDAFTDIVTSNYAAILSMGRDFESGVGKFLNAQEILTDTDGPFRDGMRMFGYSIEESSKFMGDFIEANRYALNLQNMTADELAARTFEYAKNLNVIAEATGQEADAIRERRLGLMAEGALQGKLQQMTLEGRGAEAKAIADFIATIEDPAIRQAALEYYAFDGALVTKQSNLVAMALDGLLGAFETKSIDQLKTSQASLAQNADLLNIATLSLLDDAPMFANVVSDLVAGSQKALSLLGGKTFSEYMDDRERDLITPTDEFMGKLINVGTELEALPNRIRSNLIEPLEGFLNAQLSLLNLLVDGNELSSSVVGGSTSVEEFIENNPSFAPYMRSYPGMYGGGNVGGGMYMVGERGPELLRLNQGSMGHVYNHGQTKSMLRGRAGGGGVVGMGSMGSLRLGEKGKVQQVVMGLDADTSMSLSRQGMLELTRSLGGGYSFGVEGPYKEGASGQTKHFTQDQNTTGNEKHYDKTTMAHHMAEGFKAKTGFDHPAGEQGYQQLLNELKNMNKTMKNLLGKAYSGDGYF